MIFMKKVKSKLIIALLAVGDILVFLAGYWAVRLFKPNPFVINLKDWYKLVFPLFFILFFFIMYDLYKTQVENVFNCAISAGLSVLAAMLCYFAVVYIFPFENLSVVKWLIRFGVLAALMVLWRSFAAVMVKKFGEKVSCLIIENMDNTSRLARKIKYAQASGRESAFYMIDESDAEEIDMIINEKIQEYDQIFISPAISKEILSRIMSRATLLHKQISVLADLDSVTTMRGRIRMLDDTPVVEKKVLHISRMECFLKRAFDIVFSVIGCLVTLPIIALCAAAIRLDSKGPVIYKQERYTKNKRVFTVYKFRTMYTDAEKNGAQLATEDDPRITRVGKFLRATRLDEIPQLYNILFGHMSVVGPRPERPIFADRFSEDVGNYDTRYFVKAGLTGYAQVYGKYNTRASDKILMDLIYITNYSFLLDIKLIILTTKTMFVKSATEGLNEENDKMLSSEEKEEQRRAETVKILRG